MALDATNCFRHHSDRACVSNADFAKVGPSAVRLVIVYFKMPTIDGRHCLSKLQLPPLT